MQSRGRSIWRDGRAIGWLFATTIVLPSLALAAFAYRALDSDHRLAEQVWRERMQEPVRSAYADLERRMLEIRVHSQAVANGKGSARPGDGTIEVILSNPLQMSPASAFAWVPDGRAPRPATPPHELDEAEIVEARSSDPKADVSTYLDLLRRVPPLWRSVTYLRLARVLARQGMMRETLDALQHAANLPDSPGAVPSRFAALFQLANGQPDSAARLYAELSAGSWLLEKSPYSFYEMRLREWAAGRIPPDTLVREQRRQALSRLLERVVHGDSGWLTDGPVSALVTKATGTREAAIFTLDSQLTAWVAEVARAAPADVLTRVGPGAGRSHPTVSLGLAPLGLPWSVWCEPRDAELFRRASDSRARLSLAILILVGGVLLFGSIATVTLVRRELRIAQVQSDFAATISHEFRSPITGIRQLAEMLLAGRAAEDPPRRRQYYELICRESARLTRLVDGALEFARVGNDGTRYRVERIETAEWLLGLVGVAAQRRAVDTDLPPGLPAVMGDKDALSSAVLNLLDNAIKYSPVDTIVTLLASGEGEWVTIAVRDHGCGVAADEQRRIFDRFYRGGEAGAGSGRGLGLGLALVKCIADAHGGRLRVESLPGQGSTFYLSLKAAL